LNALAAARGPEAAKKHLADLEASYVEEATIRKQQAHANVPKWIAARKALASGK
jgi:hypothetical protein